MQETFADLVLATLEGMLVPEYRVPGVENLFETGKQCDLLYAQMLNAYENLCVRLGVAHEDTDVEIILHSLMEISRIVSLKMYEYGSLFAKK